jgi:hypothetical protein
MNFATQLFQETLSELGEKAWEGDFEKYIAVLEASPDPAKARETHGFRLLGGSTAVPRAYLPLYIVYTYIIS